MRQIARRARVSLAPRRTVDLPRQDRRTPTTARARASLLLTTDTSNTLGYACARYRYVGTLGRVRRAVLAAMLYELASLSVLLVAFHLHSAHALDNGLAITP